MSTERVHLDSPLERWPALGRELGCDLYIKRDDLLPFPLAGNKVRKLVAEAESSDWRAGDVLITNGGVASNHCRTVAFMAALRGAKAHLVLHGSVAESPSSVAMLEALGATYDIVSADQIEATIDRRVVELRSASRRVQIVPGGAHTPAAVRAYQEASRELLAHLDINYVVVASGTGATQAGITLGAREALPTTHVTGISVARTGDKGRRAVVEAIEWIDPTFDGVVDFDDRFTDGGYGRNSAATREVVERLWRHGLPLDSTYTGKAMRGLTEKIRAGEIARSSKVLFWHTGGLANAMAQMNLSSEHEEI